MPSRLVRFSSSCLYVILVSMSVQAQSNPSFAPAVGYNSGGPGAFSVAVADVNGDGTPDLLVTNQCVSSENCANGSVGVLLGNGDGTFQTAVTYGSGGYDTLSVAVADVNGDGKPDIVVANACVSSENCANGSVGVLLGNGDGTFQLAVTYGSGGYQAVSVVVADVDGDGTADLLVVNSCADSACVNGSVGVLLGNGDGTFRTAVTYGSGGHDAISAAVAVLVEDVNRDGKPDLVVANICANFLCETDGIVGVLLGNGDGTFQAAVTYDSGGLNPYSVAVADVNGNGSQDIVVANLCVNYGNCANGSVGVLLGNGDGTFQTAVTYSSGGNSISVAVADVNGDGKLDIVVANVSSENSANGSVGVLLGNRNGTFQPAVTYGSGGHAPESIMVVDLNGDGKPDIVVANFCASANNCSTGSNSNVGVLLNTERTTYETLVTATKEDVRNRLVVDIMVGTLGLAKDAAAQGHRALADLLLKDFIDEVKWGKSVKLVTAANAAILIQEANALMI